MNIEQARFNMIEQQIRPWDVLDPEVLRCWRVLKREDFVPAAYRSMAFVDTEIPLPEGQCMLAPRVEARLLQELQLQRHETRARGRRRLRLHGRAAGAPLAPGHQPGDLAAAGAHGPGEPARRRGDERLGALHRRARGLRGDAPFDAIVLSGSVATVPQTLLEQLKIGGRLVAIVGDEPVMRARLYTRVPTRHPGRRPTCSTRWRRACAASPSGSFQLLSPPRHCGPCSRVDSLHRTRFKP